METFEHAEETSPKVLEPVEPPKRRRRVSHIVGGFTVIVILATLVPAGIAFGYDRYFSDRIFPSVKTIAGNISGLTRRDATALLERRINELLDNGVVFSFDGKRFAISKTTLDSKQLIHFDSETAAKEAFELGRTGSFIEKCFARYRMLLGEAKVIIPLQMDEQALAELVSKHFASEVKAAVNAAPLIKIDGLGEVRSIGIAPASSGNKPYFIEAIKSLHTSLSGFENRTINIKVDTVEPEIHVSDAEPHLAEISTLLAQKSILVVYKEASWVLGRRDIANSLTFFKNADGVQTGVDPKKLKTFLKPIRKVAEIPATSAIFTMKEDKVVEFEPHVDGIGIDEETLASTLRDALYQNKAGIELPLKPTKPEVTTESSNTLGIKEMLGDGYSSFKGSPTNRIKNIKNGVSRLNFSLIPPDTEFSLVSTLKPFDEKGGYLPELVIKGNKLEPELGGGLCQIGTTTFRAAMNSGLPITERQNHSLVVSYYNDPANGLPGSDATIYDAHPDLRFKNDTGHYILVVAKATAKNGLDFSFWGTSDGRKGSYEPPKVSKWNPVPKDAKTLYLESSSVKTGEQKCKAGFAGATASLDYTVESPDGEKTTRTFTSIYRMLPPVCLVAKGEIPKDEPLKDATATIGDVPISASDAVPTTQ
ncbi:MAG: VanW family protein [bacterium]